MWKAILIIITACTLSLFTNGIAQSDESITVVDEPSVKLEAELNLHYKTFSEIKLSDLYLERWLLKYNYHPVSDMMADKELFSAINLNHDGLESVKAAVDAGNFEKAKFELADYFKNRPEVVHIDPGTLNPSRKSIYIERSDELLNSPDFPNHPWDRERLGKGSKDAWWNWLSNLYYAYRYTNDMKYLNGLMEMLSFWYETVRPPEGTPKIWLTPSFMNNPWGSHLSSYRLHTFSCFNDILTGIEYDDVSVDERIVLYKSTVEHARFLISVNPGYRAGNIQLHQMLNLLETGINYPELKESKQWIDFAWNCFLKHVHLGIMPDGGYFERSTGYNNAVINFFRKFLKLAHIAGMEEPDWLKIKIKHAQEWTIKVYSPILNLTPVGDSSMQAENFAVPYLIDGALSFPCPEFKYFVKDYPDELRERAKELFGDDSYNADKVIAELESIVPKKPDYTSVNLPDTGWAIMRSDWTRDARYLLFDYGNNEPWHCHRDGLGFSIYAFGEPLITDCGHGGSYDSDRSKLWYKETISNNLVTINGMSQRKITSGTCDKWVTSQTADYANAIHDGYKYLGAYSRRKITFVKPNYWIITDNLTEKMCQTTGYHECEWLAHFQPTELTIDKKSKVIRTNNPDVNILVLPLNPETIKVNESTGWAVTPDGEVDDAPYIGYTREGDLPVDYEVVIYPYEGIIAPDIKVESLDMGDDAWRCKGLKITSPDGIDYYLESLKADYYFVVDEKSAFRNYGEFSFDGEMALIREKNSVLNSILLVGGTTLKRNDKTIAICSDEIDWVEIQFINNGASVDGDFEGKISITLPDGSYLVTG